MFTGMSIRLPIAVLAAISAFAFGAFGAREAQAQSQTVNYSASVTVQNTFTVGMTTPLSFGTIAAIADPTAGTQAQLVLSANAGTSAVTNPALPQTSRILAVSAATPGVIAISAAPPSTLITVTNGSTVQLNDPASATETNFDFTPAAVCAAFNCTTDVAGALTVNVGGTLATRQQTGTEAGGYTDGTYTGTFSVTFAF